MSRPRRKVTEADAAELVTAWRSSRRALPTWCAAHGIDGRSLRHWASRLSEPTTIRLIEVTLPLPIAPQPLRVAIDDVVIEVPDGFTSDTLIRVLAAVRSC